MVAPPRAVGFARVADLRLAVGDDSVRHSWTSARHTPTPPSKQEKLIAHLTKEGKGDQRALLV